MIFNYLQIIKNLNSLIIYGNTQFLFVIYEYTEILFDHLSNSRTSKLLKIVIFVSLIIIMIYQNKKYKV